MYLKSKIYLLYNKAAKVEKFSDTSTPVINFKSNLVQKILQHGIH